MNEYDCKLIEHNNEGPKLPYLNITACSPDTAAESACRSWSIKGVCNFEDGDDVVVEVSGDQMDGAKRYQVRISRIVDFNAEEADEE